MCPRSGKLLPIPTWTERKDICGPCSAKYRKNRLSSIAMSHPQLLRQRPQNPLPNPKHNSGFTAEPCCERRSCCAAEPTRRALSRCASRGILVPSLSTGQIVVMDNLSAHKGARVRHLIEEHS